MGFRVVRQTDSMNCGAAAMAMLCAHYRCNVSRQEIDRMCVPTIQGISIKGLRDVAETLGFEAYSLRLTADRLYRLPGPCILHWNQNHFVTLYKSDPRRHKFYIADPAKGKYHVSESELKKHWLCTELKGEPAGIALIVCPTERMERRQDKEQQGERRSFRFLWGYVVKYRKYFATILSGLLLGCVLQLIMPFLTQWIVDVGIRTRDIGFIWLILLGELMIVTGSTATGFIRRWILLHISMRINISLVSDFFIKLLRLPMPFFDTRQMGDLLQRIEDHSRVQSFLTNQFLNIIFTFLSFIIFGVVLFVYDPLIFGIFLAGSVVYGVWISVFLNRRKVLDYELFGQQAINRNRTYQFITCMQEIKLQDCERRRREEWEDTQADLFEIQMKALRLQQTQEAGSVFIHEVKNILITVFAATAVIEGDITLGGMLAIQYIVGQLNSPVEQLMSFIYSVQDVKISLERINEVHGSRNEEPEQNRLTAFGDDKGITLAGVCFKYDRFALKNTLEGIDFEVPQGKVTAIVGASGSGKTTLMKLMLGYYPVNEGRIAVGGRDINDYNVKWWRRQCGVVMQDGVIFSESIERNIAVGDGPVDTERLHRAASIANIHEFVTGLPLRYETKIGRDGLGLSQGQKQRILIARAVYKEPAFIFLDEATNALDAKNERAIVENLTEFYRGRTVVVVAHRLSTVRNADRIVVLDSGRVVETGDHDSLTARRGAYYNLVRNQLELGT